jgi:WD40 repeat protein
MSFSPNGKYLATAGEDGKVLIWSVSPKISRMNRNLSQQHGNIFLRSSGSAPLGTEVQLLSSHPVAIFDEHQAEVVGLSWSKQQAPGATDATHPLLLSASLDKTVRLWHVSRPGALHIFQHADMVTCVDFHPTNDSYFISGGFDLKLRCWSIPNGRVKAWAQCPDIITAAQYSPNGNLVAAGLMKGQVYFYMTDGMKYYTQLESKNRRGRASDGRKVTGLMFRVNLESFSKKSQHRRCTSTDSNSVVTQLVGTPERLNNSNPMRGRTFSDQSSLGCIGSLNASGNSRRWQEHLLVTTNDSRLRLYEMDGFCAIQKYKGVLNTKMQIKASFSESG